MARFRWVKGTNDFIELPPGYAPPVSKGPIMLGDYSAYDCPVTGKIVEGRYQHSENLKRQGCRLLETGESRDAPKRVEESYNAEVDRILDQVTA